MKKLQAIITDYDGTLVDSLSDQFAWFRHITGLFGLEFKYAPEELSRFKEDYSPRIVDNYWDFYEFLGFESDKNTKTTIWKEYDKWKQKSSVKVIKGMPEIIEILREDYGIGSKKEKPLLLALNTSNSLIALSPLSRTGCLKYFNLIITKDDLPEVNGKKRLKPDPYSIELCIKLLGVEPERTLHLGDTISDITACKKTGVKTLHFTWEASYDPKWMIKEKPDFTASSPEEALDIIVSLL